MSARTRVLARIRRLTAEVERSREMMSRRYRRAGLSLLFGLPVLLVALIVPAATSATTKLVTRTFTVPGTSVFTVPSSVMSLQVVAVGGMGAAGGSTGGFGGRVSGNLAVTPGEVLYVDVAANGDSGGTNGGGSAGLGCNGSGGTGGGASDVRTSKPTSLGPGDPSLSSRLLVAGGGGGGGGTDFMEPSLPGGAGGNAGSPGQMAGGEASAGGGGAGTASAGGAGGTGYFSFPSGGEPSLTGGSGVLGGGGASVGDNSGCGSQFGARVSGGGGGGGLYGGGAGGGVNSDDTGGGGGGGGGSIGYTSALSNASVTTDTTGTPLISFTYPCPTGNSCGPQLQITTTSLPNGNRGHAYTATVHATGGTTPYEWSITHGVLPTGLHLDANTGAITGTPTNQGKYTFTVNVSDASEPAMTAQRQLAITITGLRIVSIRPTSSGPAGGRLIRITGYGFTPGAGQGDTVCFFPADGGSCTEAQDVSVISDTLITATIPPENKSIYHSSGDVLVNVRVTYDSSGLFAMSNDVAFTYLVHITAISPTTSGPAGGGTIKITGYGFTPVAGQSDIVCFFPDGGGNCTEAQDVSVVSDTEVTAKIPPQNKAIAADGGKAHVKVEVPYDSSGLHAISGYVDFTYRVSGRGSRTVASAGHST